MATVWRCAFESTWFDGQKIVNTFHVQTDLGLGETEPSADSIRDDLLDALKTKYKALIWDAATLDSFVVTEELAPGSSDIPASSSAAIGEAGTHSPSNTHAPTEMCALLQLRTASASKSSRGRMFLPPIVNEAYVTRDAWTTGGQISQITAFADELITTHDVSEDGGVTHVNVNTVVYSRTRRGLSLTPYTFLITHWAREARPHWLRSRGN
jgi:hypothetical protein